ncbi:MAG: murein biosynthesis integral membrane protein MurJ [Xanthomonadales bacterium]|nr:murein biosynthesis integral membrane protein MurJ [Gammaproteobacteria bacterium]MBT8050840.1 murein biosynthesis integral membrane protein MurJ [Gammaproteobacteria bacterium]MBT8057740.1 murein biosynthesis integral membrane protein MurJ [Gammaproteobacteria bacterium]NNJ78521.1 murein biosynthesis integral membrane protein MurJ [Xanthomonadales bacterium]NNL04791.1 murein biosynthesis integral membrane protein MurJ [Xanthomonadales bacterium]
MQLLKSTAKVGVATIVSRILGFVRDMVFARYFGASAATDAFFLAFKIPNFMRRLFAEGSFSLAFVPVLSEVRASGDRAALRDLVDHVSGTLLGVLLVITSIGVLAAPAVLAVFAPGWMIEGRPEFDLAADMLRITFPYILLISLTALAGGILNTFDRFLVPALTPALLNVSLILCAVLLSARLEVPVKALAWGVLIAGFAQLLVQVPALLRLGVLPRPRWGWRHSGVRKILRLMIPTLIGSSVAQINLLLDLVIATFLVSGSVSWLYYSDRLMEFPLGVFGVALSTVILPNLSRKFASKNPEAFSHTLDWALRLAVIITLPAALGLAALSQPILVTLFQYQAFEVSDVQMSAMSLVAYAAGLPAFIAVKVLAPGFYARQDTKTPVKIAITAMVSNMGLNLLFVGALLAIGFSGPHTGLALASSAAAYLNAGLLYRVLRKQGVYTPEPGWGRVWMAVVLACAAMAAALAWQYGDLQGWVQASAAQRATHLVLLIGFGALVYGATLLAGGLRSRHVSKGSS